MLKYYIKKFIVDAPMNKKIPIKSIFDWERFIFIISGKSGLIKTKP